MAIPLPAVPSLLITDDDRDLRETLGSIFEPRGFRTLLAGDGEEALEIVRREPIHLLLLDLHMPRLDGLATARRARQLRQALPCILISGKLNEEIRQQALAAEFFSILAKPFQLAEITSAVLQAMRENYGWPQ